MSKRTVLEALAADYPLLYLNPDTDTQETYRFVVLRGGEPETMRLDHYAGDAHDRDETVDTPAGQVRVVTLGNRRDFELVLRGLMAAKNGPLDPIPETQGAATMTVFNWPRIRAHLAQYPQAEQTAEFKRFTAVKENYTDMLIVLSRGPYSHVDAAAAGLSEEEWLDRSDVIRRYHELTHVICRRQYPDDVAPIRDELVADAVGLYAAFGRFDPALDARFLGIRDGRYIGGRLENYTDTPDALAERITDALARMERCVDARAGAAPFDLIPALMAAGTCGNDAIP